MLRQPVSVCQAQQQVPGDLSGGLSSSSLLPCDAATRLCVAGFGAAAARGRDAAAGEGLRSHSGGGAEADHGAGALSASPQLPSSCTGGSASSASRLSPRLSMSTSCWASEAVADRALVGSAAGAAASVSCNASVPCGCNRWHLMVPSHTTEATA